MRLRTFVLGMSALLLISFILILSQGPITPVVSVNSLRIEIVTDKEEYSVGERIQATLIFFNDRSHPVKFQAVTQYSVTGYHSNEPVSNRLTGENYISHAKAYRVIQANSNSTLTRETFVSGYAGEYIIHIYGATRDHFFDVTKIVAITEENYQELWNGEIEIANPRFLPIDKNKSIDMSAFWGVSSKITAMMAKNIPIITETYVHHSLDWQNGTAYIIINDASPNVTQFYLDQFRPHTQTKIKFLKSPASRKQMNLWRAKLQELCLDPLTKRGVKWTSLGTYYNGKILLEVEELTPETIDILLEIIDKVVPPGVIVLWGSGPVTF